MGGQRAGTPATNDVEKENEEDEEEEEWMTGVLGEPLLYHSRTGTSGENLPLTWQGMYRFLRRLCHGRSSTRQMVHI